VDYEASVRAALENLLKSAGYEVDTYASAESFLHSGRLSSTDCLLLDVRMSGMSGVELQEYLDRVHAEIPIVFMTAHPKATICSRALAVGVVEFLEKPFRSDELIQDLLSYSNDRSFSDSGTSDDDQQIQR
jgi:FixJ family two-component response regulator